MISSKYRVLNLMLEGRNDHISGQEMAEKLNISRTAINKAVTALRAEGYEIEAVNKLGYRIINDPDLINYGEFLSYIDEKRTDRIAIFDSVISTNVVLHELAEKGAESGQTVIASSQSAGRGRHGGSFDSPDDKSIYMSYLIVPEGEIDIKKVTPLVLDSVADTIREIPETEGIIKIEYPGNLFLEEKKICGILTEVLMEAESGYLRYLMVGIGVRPVKGMKRSAFTAKLIKQLDSCFLSST